jgi:hypothetical protein
MKQDIFVHQAKYTKNIMKKFNMDELKPMSTPMSTTMTLDPDRNSEAVDQREYMSMIASLLYHTVTRPDIVRRVHVCTLSVFPMLLTSDISSVNLQISQTHP